MNEECGIVAENVMRDSNLSAKAKGLYAYLASLSGNDGFCCPSFNTMLKELNTSEATLRKCMDQLISSDIIVRERTRNGNLNGHNVYRINDGLQEVRKARRGRTIC